MSTPPCEKQRDTKVTELLYADIGEFAKRQGKNVIAFVEYSDILDDQGQYHVANNYAKGVLTMR